VTECFDDEHIVLIGMMGVGKSSVGRALAAALRRPLFDTDTLVEQAAGRSVRDIWTVDGERAFRDLEAEIVAEVLAAEEPSVVAAAGGVVVRPENRAVLAASNAHVVWLCADVQVLLARVRNGMHRPALDNDPEGTLVQMFDARAPLYKEVADAIVSVDHRSVGDVAQAVLRCCA